jgi:hypothetical protein
MEQGWTSNRMTMDAQHNGDERPTERQQMCDETTRQKYQNGTNCHETTRQNIRMERIAMKRHDKTSEWNELP